MIPMYWVYYGKMIEQQIRHWRSTNFVCRVILIELRCKWRQSQSLGPYLWYQTPLPPSLWGVSPTVANYRRGWTATRRTTWPGSERGGPMHWPSVQNTSMNRYRTLSTNQVTFLIQECRVPISSTCKLVLKCIRNLLDIMYTVDNKSKITGNSSINVCLIVNGFLCHRLCFSLLILYALKLIVHIYTCIYNYI